ncbi:hypothetical protein [Sulfoacidibacillus thermotolerans]|uniref:Uncharacterized protein n=1 Tax=Sulfoacidibacillus thermotolerans TaxID=1765684 RepID=A0A2U3CVU9_SULT2|nr:hypothetical protein [Sulfoacidibacillus thermotolerans]PWI53145.1 hypothetical protein BM613_14000 [Sulfoacidibacillus thermotolerans]
MSKPTPYIDAFIASLPGKTIEIGFATNFFQHRGYRFLCEKAILDKSLRRFALKPVNNDYLEFIPYREVTLATERTLIVSGGYEEQETDWALRIEVRDAFTVLGGDEDE